VSDPTDLISYIVTCLTGDPHCFQLDKSLDERGVLLKLTVEQPQAGRVLGKRGETAQAIRGLLRALGTKNNARYSLLVEIDEDE
jgi:predicted RNA-binding protein YlqC (UPF0109 family)